MEVRGRGRVRRLSWYVGKDKRQEVEMGCQYNGNMTELSPSFVGPQKVLTWLKKMWRRSCEQLSLVLVDPCKIKKFVTKRSVLELVTVAVCTSKNFKVCIKRYRIILYLLKGVGLKNVHTIIPVFKQNEKNEQTHKEHDQWILTLTVGVVLVLTL